MKTSTQANELNKPIPEVAPFSGPPAQQKGFKVSTLRPKPFEGLSKANSIKTYDKLISMLIGQVSRG